MQLSEQIDQEGLPSIQDPSQLHSPSNNPPLHSRPSTATLHETFFSPIHAVPVKLIIKIQRTLSNFPMFIAATEAEYLPFAHPRRISKGVIAAAVDAAQQILDSLQLAFMLKMEHGPAGPWHLPALQHSHMAAVAEATAVTLDSLRKAIEKEESMER